MCSWNKVKVSVKPFSHVHKLLFTSYSNKIISAKLLYVNVMDVLLPKVIPVGMQI